MRPTENSYSFGFASLSLRPELARIIAEIYVSEGSWEATKSRVFATNALQARSLSSARPIEAQFRMRLQSLTQRQIELLSVAPLDSCTALAWLAVIKTTPLIMVFVADVVRRKMEAADQILRHSDYENFYSSQAIQHPELNKRTPQTRAKVRSVILSMLKEVGILSSTQEPEIKRPVIPSDVYDSIIVDNKRWLAGFLVPDAEIATLSA